MSEGVTMANPNPSHDTRFKQGADWKGNAKGRPPGRSVGAKLRELLEASTHGGQALPEGQCVADLVAAVILREALGGDFRFVSELLNRTEGKISKAIPDPPEDQSLELRWEQFDQAVNLVYGPKSGIPEELERN